MDCLNYLWAILLGMEDCDFLLRKPIALSAATNDMKVEAKASEMPEIFNFIRKLNK